MVIVFDILVTKIEVTEGWFEVCALSKSLMLVSIFMGTSILVVIFDMLDRIGLALRYANGLGLVNSFLIVRVRVNIDGNELASCLVTISLLHKNEFLIILES